MGNVIELKSKRIAYVTNFLVGLYAMLFISNNTFLGKNFESPIHWLEAFVGLLLSILFLHKFTKFDKPTIKNWVKNNIFVILFLTIGLINIVIIDSVYRYSILRSLFIEGIYLVIITPILCDSKFIKNVLFRLVIGFNLILNLLPFIINLILKIWGFNSVFIKAIIYISYINNPRANCYSFFYSNPNTMGIMTAFSMILVILLFQPTKKWYKICLYLLYFAFSIFNLVESDSRAALLSLVVSILGVLFIKFTKLRSSHVIVAGMITLAMICLGCIVYISFNTSTGMEKLNKKEMYIDRITSDRYVIWKGSYMAQRELLLFGEGSLKAVVEVRDKYLDKNYPEYYSYKTTDEIEKEEGRPKYKTFFDYVISGAFITDAFHNLDRYSSKKNSLISTYEVRKLSQRLNEKNLNHEYKEAKNTKKIFRKQIENLDTHNGYLSVLFCSGIIGFVFFLILLSKKIIDSKILLEPRWSIPVIYILFLNMFESTFVFDRYFLCTFLFIILSMDCEKCKD